MNFDRMMEILRDNPIDTDHDEIIEAMDKAASILAAVRTAAVRAKESALTLGLIDDE